MQAQLAWEDQFVCAIPNNPASPPAKQELEMQQVRTIALFAAYFDS